MKLNLLVSLRRGEPGYTEKKERGQFKIENGAKEENEGERHEGARRRVTKGDCKGEEGNEEASVRLTSLWRENWTKASEADGPWEEGIKEAQGCRKHAPTAVLFEGHGGTPLSRIDRSEAHNTHSLPSLCRCCECNGRRSPLTNTSARSSSESNGIRYVLTFISGAFSCPAALVLSLSFSLFAFPVEEALNVW